MDCELISIMYCAAQFEQNSFARTAVPIASPTMPTARLRWHGGTQDVELRAAHLFAWAGGQYRLHKRCRRPFSTPSNMGVATCEEGPRGARSVLEAAVPEVTVLPPWRPHGALPTRLRPRDWRRYVFCMSTRVQVGGSALVEEQQPSWRDFLCCS